jgi:putative hemolysin
VFYEELKAEPDAAAAQSRRDADRFDAFCDHLIVVRGTPEAKCGQFAVDDGEMVGTYRLLRQSVAEQNGGFYTQGEFDVAPLLAANPQLKFLELGRSCVLKQYRTKPVVELLWQGIWNYVRQHRLDVMLGCASLEGDDPRAHAPTLDFLARHCAASPAWNVRALPGRYVEMKSNDAAALDAKTALKALPPLIKGYLRLGCYIGEGAVIDRQFNTTDVLIILPVSSINPRYFAHFGQPDEAITC